MPEQYADSVVAAVLSSVLVAIHDDRANDKISHMNDLIDIATNWILVGHKLFAENASETQKQLLVQRLAGLVEPSQQGVCASSSALTDDELRELGVVDADD